MIRFLLRLWTFVRPYRMRLFLGLGCGILFGVLQGMLILAIRIVVEVVFPANSTRPLKQQLASAPDFVQKLVDFIQPLMTPTTTAGAILVILTIPSIMFLRAVFGYLSVYFTHWAAVRAVVDVRTKLFEHLQNLPLSFFSQAKTGDLISRITSDTQSLYGTISHSAASMVKDPVSVVVGLIILLAPREQRVLTLISMIVLPACIVPITIYSRKIRKSAGAIQTRLAEIASLMHESFTGNRVIKAYNLEAAVSEQFRTNTKKFVGHVMRVVRSNELPSQLTEFLGGVGVALVLIYVKLVLGGTANMADFVQFIVAIVILYGPIKSLARLHNQLHLAHAASARVFELLDTPSTMIDPPNPKPLKATDADIRFENVVFDYGDKPVLRGIDLTVKSGRLVALVGSSGSGKTTLANLLPRFYDPLGGAVKIGGTDIREVSIKELRRNIALVTQETILFHDTIRRNIALGRPGATDAEIEAAARHAHAHEFILQKPQGYDTIVGEKGITLSGGQRQRIAIARAIVKDAPILILDEATSSLDTESERAVQSALEELMQGRTTICIAHRLSTIQKADLIVVLSEGRVVETGTHTELIQRGGIYRKLYELQFQG